LLLAGNNAAGKYSVKHYKGKFNAYQRTYVIEIKEDGVVLYEYLKRVLQGSLDLLQRLSTGSSTKFLTIKVLYPLQIVLPSLELQTEYVKIMRHLDETASAVTENMERIRDLADSYFATQVAINVR
jgi:type I restriction enzyme S subunit